MPCTVYCLVPHRGQLDSLIEQLKEAGIETRDIAVVPGRYWRLSGPTPLVPPLAPSGEASGTLPDFWNLTGFISASSLWWQWFAGDQGTLPNPSARPDAGSRAPIPLAQYEACLRAKRSE